MFTVKHREPDGREFIYNAETVEVVPPGPSNVTVGATNWDRAGIYLDPEQLHQGYEGDPPPRFSKQVILFGGDETSAAVTRKGGMVWVMNEQGSTVASYGL